MLSQKVQKCNFFIIHFQKLETNHCMNKKQKQNQKKKKTTTTKTKTKTKTKNKKQKTKTKNKKTKNKNKNNVFPRVIMKNKFHVYKLSISLLTAHDWQKIKSRFFGKINVLDRKSTGQKVFVYLFLGKKMQFLSVCQI